MPEPTLTEESHPKLPAKAAGGTMHAPARGPAEVAAGESTVLVLRNLDEWRREAGRIDVGRSRPWWRRQLYWLLALAAAAYGLAGWYGPSHNWHKWIAALRLFPSGFPGYNSHSWGYLVGEYLAAVLSLFVTLKVIAAVLADSVADGRARWRRGHAVVCGLGDTGLRSVKALRAAGIDVTCLDMEVAGATAEDARAAGALVLRRDATSAPALEAARVQRAAYVVCSGQNDAVNTRVAALAAALAHTHNGRSAPSIHVDIADPDLAQLLRAPLASVGSVRLHFFSAGSVWARALLEHPSGPFARSRLAPLRIAVLGETNLAMAVVVGAARRWHAHVRSTGDPARLSIAVVGPSAADTCRALAERYPAIPRVCELTPVAHGLTVAAPLDLDAIVGSSGAFHALYACLDDESADLALALDAEHRLGDATAVFLPASGAAKALRPLLLGLGRIRPVELPEDADAVELLHDHMRESLARAVHQAYLDSRRNAADFGQRVADRPWNELGPESRRSSRAHVDGMVEQLQAVWFEIEPLYDWDEEPAPLTRDAIEAMAKLEHGRWCRERIGEGWRYGVPRVDRKKVHDKLVPWAALSEDDREIDRGMVGERSAILARAGFRLRHDPVRESLARQLHDRYLDARLRKGETGRLAVPWEELSEAQREHNRAAVDDIALMLASTGRRAVPLIVAPTARPFTHAEVEAMARLEHERWLAKRHAGGWTYGERDDDEKTHPSLVPWDELPEAECEKDREVARATPELLASVGYTIVSEGRGC